jgi:hypothetical protein
MKKLFVMVMLVCSAFVSANAQNVSGGYYRGFVDAGYTFGIGDYDFGRFEVNTSHGYQINSYLYVGVGAGLHFMSSYKTSGMDIPLDTRDSKVDIPVFANARCNILKGKISPFIDLKGGTYVNNNGGLYANLSAGCRIATRSKQAVNISVGYTTEKLEFQTFSRFTSNNNLDYTRKPTKYDAEGITLKVGYEF